MKAASPDLQIRHVGFFGILVAMILCLSTGCLIIPVDYHDRGVRHNINTQTRDTLQSGVTTKEEVFLTLGEPDFASEDGQRLGYAWTKVKALIIWASYGGSGGGEEVKRSYVLDVSFDASNRVSEVRLLKEWGSQVTPRQELDSPVGTTSTAASKEQR